MHRFSGAHVANAAIHLAGEGLKFEDGLGKPGTLADGFSGDQQPRAAPDKSDNAVLAGIEPELNTGVEDLIRGGVVPVFDDKLTGLQDGGVTEQGFHVRECLYHSGTAAGLRRNYRQLQAYLGKMAYRLERCESVIAGLKRVVRDEIESASEHLSGLKKTGRDEAIHEARKSIKKVRALLRIAGGELGGTGTREGRRLRDIGRRLSEFRDAFVMIDTFDSLKRKYRRETARKLGSVRRGLLRRRTESRREEEMRIVLQHASAALMQVAERVAEWPLVTDGYAAISDGLESTYRAGRAALERVRENGHAENYHELRKRVKDHWYHVRLLENLWTDVMTTYEKTLKDLETWLGEDHNLAVLRERVKAEPDFYGSQEDIALLDELIVRYQTELRQQSLSLAERIYEEKPREFRRRMKHLWDTWQHEPELEKSSTAA